MTVNCKVTVGHQNSNSHWLGQEDDGNLQPGEFGRGKKPTVS